jgi:hypothetical protein
MSAQNLPPATPGFDGHTFEPDRDGIRLSGQMRRIYNLMSDRQWRTLHEIADATSCLETAASARLRDFRKARFGGHAVELRRVPGRPGVFQYRLLLKKSFQADRTDSGLFTSPKNNAQTKS